MEKFFIKNRKGQKVSVIVEEARPQKGLAFVMHGLGGFKESPQTRAVADVLHECGYTVITFDTTNTFGESDGKYEDATTTNYYEDLEDVIAWAKIQPWYHEPFVLAGFSLGGLCVALYAENHPGKVRASVLLGTVVSGKLRVENSYQKEKNKKWKRTGWCEEESASKPGVIKRLPWSHMEDCLKYDLLAPIISHPEEPQYQSEARYGVSLRDEGSLANASNRAFARDSSPPKAGPPREEASGLRMTDKLTMPVLLVVGELDESCPPEHQKILYETLPGPKELHLIPGAPHTFREPQHLAELKKIFKFWLNTFEHIVP